MKQTARRIVYGVILWAVSYAAAIPLLPLQASDPIAFKAFMACIGSLIGAACAAFYFLSVERRFLAESIVTAFTWIAINWVGDVLALLPFTHESISQYFMHIGIEYIGILGVVVAMGYVLEKKLAASVDKDATKWGW